MMNVTRMSASRLIKRLQYREQCVSISRYCEKATVHCVLAVHPHDSDRLAIPVATGDVGQPQTELSGLENVRDASDVPATPNRGSSGASGLISFRQKASLEAAAPFSGRHHRKKTRRRRRPPLRLGEQYGFRCRTLVEDAFSGRWDQRAGGSSTLATDGVAPLPQNNGNYWIPRS